MDQKNIRLVTRGDDIGSFRSANRAALEVCETGILRNISVMACTPYVDEAFALFRNMQAVCVGVHLMINSEWDIARWKPMLPAADIPSLVGEDGCFLQNPGLNHKRGVVFKEIMAELQAQLDALRKTGFDVSYADTHMQFGWLFEKDDKDRLEEHMQKWAESEGLLFTNGLACVKWFPYDDDAGADPVDRVLRNLEKIADGTYALVSHPAYDDEEMRGASSQRESLGRSRDWERRIFCDPRILQYCRDNGIDAITYLQAVQNPR